MWGSARFRWANVSGMMMGVGFCVYSLSACSSPPPQSAQLPDGSTTTANKSAAVPEVAAKPAETTPPPTPAGWPTAELVVAANLDGEGPDELVVWGPSGLTLWAQGESQPYAMTLSPDASEEKLEGAPNVMIVQDLDKDGRDDVLLGYGMTRGALNPPVTLAALRLKGESGKHKRTVDILYRVSSERPQVTGLSVADVLGDARPEILLSWFDSKYFVTTMAFFLRTDGDPLSPPPGNAKASPYLTGTPYARMRMATSWAFGTLGTQAKGKTPAKASMVLGRPYGEEKLSPGDIFVLTGPPGKMETRELIPAQLGVRSVTIGDGDGDGTSEVYFGDGWHYEYGTKARGRLSVSSLDPAQKGPGRWLTRLIEDTQGQYEIGQIVIDDVDGDQKPEILASGDKFIALYWFEEGGWKVRKIADGSNFAVTRTSKGKAVAIAGKPLRLVLIGGRTDGAPVSKTVSQPGTVR